MKFENIGTASRLFGALCAMMPTIAHADNWIFVEALVFPTGCETWSTCVESATANHRNFLTLDDSLTESFLVTLDAIADIRNVPPPPELEPEANAINITDVIPILSVYEVTKGADVLRGLPGVYFDASKVTGEGYAERFVLEFTEMLNAAGIPVLTEEEALLLPGAGKMSVSLSVTTDNGGCILPFSASLSLKEELVLVRDPTIKLIAGTWSGSVAQNFANTNYGGYNALQDAAQKFIDDYLAANPE